MNARAKAQGLDDCDGEIDDYLSLLEQEYELEIQLAVAASVRAMEMDDPRDKWRHTGETPPVRSTGPAPAARPYRTARSTIDAFKYLAQLGDSDRLGDWLDRHPRDAAYLVKLLSDEGK